MDDDFSHEQDSKKRKVCCEVDGSIAVTGPPIRANDTIKLVFHSASQQLSEPKVYSPEYTHQLFDNEQIDFIPDTHSGQVKIYVDCRDLSQKVIFENFSTREIEELSSKLQKVLPDMSLINANCDTLKPPGKRLLEFSQTLSIVSLEGAEDSTSTFEIWLATAKDFGASDLLHRAEKIAMWFIETADSVDFSDDRWEAIFLYSVRTPTVTTLDGKQQPGQQQQVDSSTSPSCAKTRSFVGYMTLFSFRNPFRGTKLRVCQALVLPHMQAGGLGREMLLCVYKHLVMGREEVSELTVEDPAPGFQRMRDSVDFQLFFNHFSVLCPDAFGGLAQPFAGGPTGAGVVIAEDGGGSSSASQSPQIQQVVQLLPSDAAAVASTLKIVTAQAQFLLESVEYFRIVREILLTSCADSSATATPTAVTPVAVPAAERKGERGDSPKGVLESHASFKNFRLKVKRRILKNDKDLAALAPITEMQRALAEEFESELKRFRALESTAVRLGVIPKKLC